MNKTIADLCREKLSKLSNDKIREIVGASGICNILDINANDIIKLVPTDTPIICGDLEKFLDLPVEELLKINNHKEVANKKREEVSNEFANLIFKYRDDVPFLKNHNLDTKEKIKDYLLKDVTGITSAVIAYSFEYDLRNLLKYDDYKNFAINFRIHDLDIINKAQNIKDKKSIITKNETVLAKQKNGKNEEYDQIKSSCINQINRAIDNYGNIEKANNSGELDNILDLWISKLTNKKDCEKLEKEVTAYCRNYYERSKTR